MQALDELLVTKASKTLIRLSREFNCWGRLFRGMGVKIIHWKTERLCKVSANG